MVNPPDNHTEGMGLATFLTRSKYLSYKHFTVIFLPLTPGDSTYTSQESL